MKSKVVSPPPIEPTIVLELSVDEFVAFYALNYSEGGGNTVLRSKVSEGLREVKVQGGDTVKKAIRVFEEDNSRGWIYERIDRALREARR